MSDFVINTFLPFTQELYKQFTADHVPSNFFISPLSIYSALSLLLAGSETRSREELTKALQLHGKMENAKLHQLIGQNLRDVADGDTKKTLLQANAVFMDTNPKIKPEYTGTLKDVFEALLRELNISGDCEGARSTINGWISENTKEKIKELLPSGSISPLTRLVLTNAIYFKGTWKDQFAKMDTDEQGEFKLLSGQTIKTPMMFQKKHHKRADFVKLEVTALKVPFHCHEMLIVLPEKDDGLPDVLKRMSEQPKLFSELFTSDQYFSEEVTFTLPRFSLGGETMPLKDKLGDMGLKSIFSSEEADFSGITGDRSLSVSDVYHAAVIDVDEEGAEAAAATAIPMMMRCMPRPPAPFHVDHPFIFFIVTKTGFPVFMGHVVEPKVKE